MEERKCLHFHNLLLLSCAVNEPDEMKQNKQKYKEKSPGTYVYMSSVFGKSYFVPLFIC